jgi:hypothetical protein
MNGKKIGYENLAKTMRKPNNIVRQIAESPCDRDDHDGVPSVNHRNIYLSSIQKEKKNARPEKLFRASQSRDVIKGLRCHYGKCYVDFEPLRR